jgi:hypothetical protein
MNIQDETYKILGQRLLDEFDSIKMVEWAVDAIKMGYDSESLIILAGLDFESTEERENYFWKSVKELNLNIKREESELINDYAKYVANAVLNNQLSAKSGLAKMMIICRSTEYDSKYIQFYEISEDLDYLKYDEEYPPIYNQGITLENVDEYIKKEFKFFLECEELGIEREMLEKVICNNCGQITKPELKTKFQITKPFKYKEFVCKDCKSNKIDSFGSQIGKEKILKKIKTRHNKASNGK